MEVKTVMVGERRFHLPFVDIIPFDKDQNESLGEAIRQAGAVLVPIVCWKEKHTRQEDTVVDGAHRVTWAAHHGLTKVPIIQRSFDSEDEARDECEILNTERRHLESTKLALLRTARIQRIAERRQRGESQRAIAEAENISRAQVVEDLKAAGGQGGCPPGQEPTAVIGRDGKTYPAKQGICERCR